MVDEEEIIRVAKLMKIDHEDHTEHVSRVKKMLEYFDILDQIDLSTEEITSQQKSLNELRKDELDEPEHFYSKIHRQCKVWNFHC